MSTQRSKDTGPEMAIRKALHAMGMRYRVHVPVLAERRRKADIVFSGARVAIFVDGCFWHGCPEHGRRHHQVNEWYWPEKIARNRRRDADTDERLAREGWLAIRVWEHEDPLQAAQMIREQVGRRTPQTSNPPSLAPVASHHRD